MFSSKCDHRYSVISVTLWMPSKYLVTVIHTHSSLPAAAEAGRGPVLDGGGPRVPVPGCGGQSPHTGSTGLSWPPGGPNSAAHGHHIYKMMM